MKRTWTKVGEKIVGLPLENYDGDSDDVIFDRAAVVRAINALKWLELPKEGEIEVPAMPGYGIQTAIKELRIPKVSHIAWTNQLAPYGFYGIRGHYKNGDAEIYIADLGSELTPVCSDFTPKEEVSA